MKPILITAGIGYLLGSIPFGYLLVRMIRGTDIRQSGSGNIGATNVARTSPKLGLMTLALDAAKGLAAVVIAAQLFPGVATLMFIAALAAVCGHIFPVWLGFRGGKGVATGLGSFVSLIPMSILAALAIFVLLVISFRYVALGSIIAAASLPVMAVILGETQASIAVLMVAAACLLIILKHHQNIRRIFSGTEPKFNLKRR